ncbi:MULTISPECIES: metallophosphoesterase [unclassified Megasphaera]|uniref:metallophosphoesterase family protein n=1 Tax=unclassified Megasphaera TaxID=2626256 RepID=UPI00073E3095|nr:MULTISPECIES: YfcE family phosphodiesterase [unclassified Megasphaera]KUH55381.1 phosphodiesterase [Megasphaera sp. DJF_B143]
MSVVRIGLVSDSHGRFSCLEQMVDQAPDVCCWIHGGDYCEDAEDLGAYAAVPVYAVLGNNDYLTDLNVPERRLVKAAGLTIAVIHGSQWYGEKRLQKLEEWGHHAGADLVVFGHTHRQYLLEREDLVIVNPGSISRPRDGREGTYAIVIAEDGRLADIQFYHLQN